MCRWEKKTQRNFSFPCSLNPSNIPSPTANWKVSLDFLPVVTEQKKEGNDGQQREVFKMLQSRKIVSVNVLTYGSTLFVKATMKSLTDSKHDQPLFILNTASHREHTVIAQ